MRNLKRVLAMAMAMVMILGMMVIGSSAASYTDAAAIDAKYTEAVEVLSNIGVFRGQSTTSAVFAPSAKLTRAEAATLIYRVITGDVEDKNVDLYDYASFKDVKAGEWFTPYVTYASNKYIKGDGTGNFNPYAQVTGIQVLTIMLRAAGYGANGEYEGAGWMDNVLTDAQELKLVSGIATKTLADPASRELVAQLLFNCMTKAEIVTYTPALGYLAVNFTENNWRDSQTLGQKVFGLEETNGVINAVGRKAGTTTLIDNSTAANGTVLAPVTVTGTDTTWTDIGYKASVWTIATAGVKTREAVSDVTIIGKSLKATTDGTTVDKSKVDVEYGARVYFNGEYVGVVAATNQESAVTNVLAKAGTVGVKVDYIDNDNGGRAEAIVVTEYTVASVTGITNTANAGSNAIVESSTYIIEHSYAGNNTREAVAVADSSLVVDEALAVGDLVTYVEYPYSAKGANNYANGKELSGDYYVTKADSTSGKYTQINYKSTNRDHDSYVIGDVEYIVSEVNNTCKADALSYLQARSNGTYTNIGETAVVYTDPHGYILHVNTAVSAKDYLFVIRNDHSSAVAGTTYATVAYADGSIENVYLTQADQNRLNKIYSHIYTYETKANGLAISKDFVCLDKTVELDATTQLDDGLYMDNSTVIVDLRDNKVGDTEAKAVYTGWANMPHVMGAELHYVAANGVIKLAFMTEGTDYADLSTDFIVYNTGYHTYTLNADKTRTYNMNVIEDGAPALIALSEEQYDFVCTMGVGIYHFGEKGEIVANSFTAFTEPEVASAIAWNNGLLVQYTATGSAGLAYNADTVLYTLDITNGKYYQYTMTTGTDAFYTVMDHVFGTGSTKMAYVVTDKGVATEIYVVDGTLATGSALTATAWHKVVSYVDGDYVRNYIVGKNQITMHNDALIPVEEPVPANVTVDGAAWIAPVNVGDIIDLPDSGKGGTGMTVNGEYYAYGAKYPVTGDTKIVTGYVAWTLGTEKVAVAYDSNTGKALSDVFTSIEDNWVKYDRKNATSYKTGYVAANGTLKPTHDTIFVDGLYEVDATAVSVDYTVQVNGEVVTDTIFYVKADAEIIVENSAGRDVVAYGVVGDITADIKVVDPFV